MNKLIILLISSLVISNSGIHHYSFTDTDGSTINLATFAGKKILIVNTASASNDSLQYYGLDSLAQAFSDSLVVIAFPSNSFDNEPLGDSSIKSSLSGSMSPHFLLASKSHVIGENQNEIFQWLTKNSLNNALSTNIEHDFYKFLLDENGELMGVFTHEVKPMDSIILKAIGIPVTVVP